MEDAIGKGRAGNCDSRLTVLPNCRATQAGLQAQQLLLQGLSRCHSLNGRAGSIRLMSLHI